MLTNFAGLILQITLKIPVMLGSHPANLDNKHCLEKIYVQ